MLIDMEHASFGMETVANLLHVSAAIGLPALVRVPEPHRSFLSRPLDAGALGLMVPRVESRAQAEEIVRYTKFYPMGDRGMAPGTAHPAALAAPHRWARGLPRRAHLFSRDQLLST
jgi:2-keto-3-deoxy-L-rhamnonate aldolase RhmA